MTTRWGNPNYVGRHRRTALIARDRHQLGGRLYTGRHRATFCAWCDESVLTPVRDEVAVSWLGDEASTWCSTKCMQADAEKRINAQGNQS